MSRRGDQKEVDASSFSIDHDYVPLRTALEKIASIAVNYDRT